MHHILSQHLRTTNILVAEKYSFRKGISTEDAAFRITNGVFKSINQKIHVGGIFCDLAKVLDNVNHEILLAKLHIYGIREVSEDWFRFYITNIRQTVEVKYSSKSFFWPVYIEIWSSPRNNSRASIVHNIYK